MDHGLELIQFYSGNRWKFDFYDSLISWKYWKSSFSNFSYPGNTGNWIFQFSYILEILEIQFFLYFGIFPKKTRAEISRRMLRQMSRDLSYETDSGPKTKSVSDPQFPSDWVKYIFMQPPGCMKTCSAFFMQPPGCMKICLVFSLTS